MLALGRYRLVPWLLSSCVDVITRCHVHHPLSGDYVKMGVSSDYFQIDDRDRSSLVTIKVIYTTRQGQEVFTLHLTGICMPSNLLVNPAPHNQ